MGQRITIVLDNDKVSSLRNHQAAIIKKTKATCSFSNVLNLVVAEGLKAFRS